MNLVPSGTISDVDGGARLIGPRRPSPENSLMPSSGAGRLRPWSGGGLRGLPAFPLLDDVGLCVDGRRLEPRERVAGSAAGRRSWGALAAEHALQERGGLDQLACTREAGCFANYVLIQHRIHLVLSARAALTAGVACKAPSTETEAMVARANSGVTSWAMVARPSTLMCSISPARCAASRSSRL